MEHKIRKINRQSLSERIYDELKKAIVEMDFQPGDRLNDMDLAKQFGVSRTPVREAFKRLEVDGLVETIPGSMTRVASISSVEAKNAFTVVAALHALAARLALRRLTESDFEKMEQANARLMEAIDNQNPVQAIHEDAAFHRVILDRADNPEIINVLRSITPKIARLEQARFISELNAESVTQHKMIIDACRKGETKEVVDRVENNWLTLSEWANR